MTEEKLIRKVIDIRTKEPNYESWYSEVIDSNPNLKRTKKACIFWMEDLGDSERADWAYLNMETDDLEYLCKSLEDVIFKRKMEDFLKDNIGDYIEYI